MKKNTAAAEKLDTIVEEGMLCYVMLCYFMAYSILAIIWPYNYRNKCQLFSKEQ